MKSIKTQIEEHFEELFFKNFKNKFYELNYILINLNEQFNYLKKLFPNDFNDLEVDFNYCLIPKNEIIIEFVNNREIYHFKNDNPTSKFFTNLQELENFYKMIIDKNLN